MINWAQIKEHVQKVDIWSPIKEIPDEHFEYLDISSINRKEKFIDHNVVTILIGRNAPSRARQIINLGDVIVSTVRPNLNAIALVDHKFINCTASTGFCVLRPKSTLNPKYLSYWVQTIAFVEDMTRKASGASYPAVSDKIIKESKIPLPPLGTQKKIAEILDAADTLRQKTKTLIEKFDQLTQSLFLDMFGDPVMDRECWEKVSLEKCTTKIGSGATPLGGKESYYAKGISLIRSMNVHDGYFKFDSLAFINQDQAYKLNNVIVEKHDVLFNITGASVCRSTIVPDNVLPARVNQHVAILRPNKKIINHQYLNSILISKSIKNKLLSIGSKGGATREAITKKQLAEFEIPLPPLPLQNQFAVRVKAIEEQKAIAQVSLGKTEELFQSLLQKAFNGEIN